MGGMNAKARAAWRTIRECVAKGRYAVTAHFVERMHGRGFFWPDVLTVLEQLTCPHGWYHVLC